jgi:ferredoxin
MRSPGGAPLDRLQQSPLNFWPLAWLRGHHLGVSRTNTRSQENAMAYVVTEPCVGCKYTDCVVVCPVDCFHEGEKMLVIDPQECIDCDACVPECPVEAIFAEANVPAEWSDYVELNREMAASWPSITDRKEPLAGRDATL